MSSPSEGGRRSESPVHLLIVLGNSPAVISELVWHLRMVEGRCIVGFDIWTTAIGERTLLTWLGGGPWEALIAEAGPIPSRDELQRRVHCFGGGSKTTLQDISRREDTELVARCLHDQVRQLRNSLDSETQLIGSLAGGRKTMSAALQNAFMLQARPGDRLVHVLLSREMEIALTRPGNSLVSYSFPSSHAERAHGIPRDQQIEVHDIAVFPLRALLRKIQDDHIDIQDYLSGGMDYRAIVGLLSMAEPQSIAGTLKQLANGDWHLKITLQGDVVSRSFVSSRRSPCRQA